MFDIRPVALNEFSLLPAIEAEADQIYAAEDYGVGPDELPPAATEEEFSDALHIMVAGRPPVGFARIEEIDGQAHLEQLCVLPDYAGQGVGRALVAAAKAWARESGYHQMTLCTFAHVPFNAPFYASCGFAEMTNPGPELAQLRKAEHAAGLDALGPRVVMRLAL